MENGGGYAQRWLDISPERVEGWLASFAERHGATETTLDDRREIATVRAADGSVAACHAPFPPLSMSAAGSGADLAAHASADRNVGVLLVRLGGYAAGVFAGAPPRLVTSKVGSRLVHGRSAAGGTSQHRFARRREKQAREALEAAADNAAAVFRGFGSTLDALVLGGDKRSMAALRDDARLRPYFDVAVDRFLTVPDPRLAVLQDAPRLFRAVRILLAESTAGASAKTSSPDGSPLT
jgi:Actinobacteria/chloroflexi VLRF1 release factor